MALENTLVTVDAMGCQKAIAQQILECSADDLLVLKTNHAQAYEAVRGYGDNHCFQCGAALRPRFEAFDDSHGRRVRRRVFAGPEAAPGRR